MQPLAAVKLPFDAQRRRRSRKFGEAKSPRDECSSRRAKTTTSAPLADSAPQPIGFTWLHLASPLVTATQNQILRQISAPSSSQKCLRRGSHDQRARAAQCSLSPLRGRAITSSPVCNVATVVIVVVVVVVVFVVISERVLSATFQARLLLHEVSRRGSNSQLDSQYLRAAPLRNRGHGSLLVRGLYGGGGGGGATLRVFRETSRGQRAGLRATTDAPSLCAQ